MRLKIIFKSSYGLNLPRNYQEMLQGFILDSAKKGGFNLKGFNDFNYSVLKGNFNANKDKTISFVGEFNMIVSSSNDEFITSLKNGIGKVVKINNQDVSVLEAKTNNYKVLFENYVIKTLSPVACYKKVNNKNVFYNPENPEFFEIINKNIKEKYRINDYENLDFYNVSGIRKIVTRYNDTIVEAYTFECRVTGRKEYLKHVYDDGIGNRCNQGFGMVLLGNK